MLSALSCALVVLTSLLGQVAGTPSEPSDMDYKPTVLVRDFAHPGLPAHRGELAAEVVAAALEAGDLLAVVRPVYKTGREWDGRGGAVKIDDVRQDAAGQWKEDAVDIYGGGATRDVRKEAAVPDADYEVTGTVSAVGEVWWVKATLRDRAERKNLKTFSEKGEGDRALFDAAAAVADGMQTVCKRRVVAHRSMAVLRMVRRRLMLPEVAAEKLEAFDAAVPGALEPAAVRLRIALESDPFDHAAIATWATKVVERLRRADPDGMRFLVRLGADPYAALAAENLAAGDLKAAAAVHREAVRVYPGDRLPHWRALAKLEADLGNAGPASGAYEYYLERAPLDADVVLAYAAFLEANGEKEEAAARLRAYLTRAPESARADEFRKRLAALEP